MNILMVSNYDPRGKIGGTATYVTDLMESLRAIGFNVKYVGPKMPFSFLENHKLNNIEFLITLFFRVPFFSINNTIIHSQRPDFLLPFLLLKRNICTVCTLHGEPSRGIRLKKGKIFFELYTLIEKYSLMRLDALIAVSEETKDLYVKRYPFIKNKIHVVPIGFCNEKFSLLNVNEMRTKYKFDPSEKIILNVGRLEKEKDLDLLIRAFVHVSSRMDKVHLVLVGKGREQERLKALVNEIQLNVTFMNPLPHEHIQEILNCADVFALTSSYESGPLVVLESLACGVPVVSTDVGRVRQFIRSPCCGRIVEREEYPLSTAIYDILQKESCCRQKCRDMVNDFDFRTTVKQTIGVYNQVLVE